MPSIENISREGGLPRDPHDDLKIARDLYLVGGPESDRQAVTILRRVFEQSRDASGRVPLDKVDSLPQLIHLLIRHDEREEAGRWASMLLATVSNNEQWLKWRTLQDCYLWASKGLAHARQFDAALKVEARFRAHFAPRADSQERPAESLKQRVQSLFRSAVYHCQKGDGRRALAELKEANRVGNAFLMGTQEDTRMLFNVLLCVRELQKQKGSSQEDKHLARRLLTATTLRLAQLETSSESPSRGS